MVEDGRLVRQDCAHVNSEGLHILADEDAVLLGLILVGLETSCKVKHRVLEDRGRTDPILLLGWLWLLWTGGGLWWWWIGGGLASFPLGVGREAKPGLILLKLILIRGFITQFIHCIGSWYTRLVVLNNNCLDGVYPRLIVF